MSMNARIQTATASKAPTAHLLAAVLCAMILSLSACSSTPKPMQCSGNAKEYLQAQDHGSLQIPEGIDAPNQPNKLTIPPSNGQQSDPKLCLEMAPNYFGATARIAASPEEMVADWAQAWADRNSSLVLDMYSSNFVSDENTDRSTWLEQRRSDIVTAPIPAPRVTDLKVTQAGDDQRTATFVQQFGKTNVHKQLTLVREAGLWKIASERIITSP